VTGERAGGLECPARPCPTCPYATGTPPGVWDASEYRKLAGYDDQPDGDVPELAVFLCHQTKARGRPADAPGLVCRGWLAVHPDSIAVRLAVVTGQIDPNEPHRDPGVAVYPSGAEAAAAGLAAINEPPPAAQAAIDKLLRRGIGANPDDMEAP